MAKTNSGLLEFKDAQKVLIALDDATSEVKKAVVIDADGVETDIQGVQPTGKKEITSTAEVNVANYATAQVVDADLVAGNIKKDVDILGVVGSYEGAGNPNTIQTVSGTLANPFGDINAAELRTALLNKEATGYLTIDASALSAGTINGLLASNSELQTIYSNGANIYTSVETSTAYNVVWDLTKELLRAQMLSGGTIVAIEQYQDNIPTSLTVVWHPLPTESAPVSPGSLE